MLRSLRAPLWSALLLAALLALAPRSLARAQDLDLDASFEGEGEVDEESAEASGSAETESDSTADTDAESDSETASDAEAEPASDSEPGSDANAAIVQAFLGGGIGTRSFLRPTLLGAQRLEDALFPAVDVGLTLQLWPADSFSLGLRVGYQSSLGLDIQEQPLFALPMEISARAERVEFSLAPTFRLGDEQDSIALGFPIGFGMRTFWPEVNEFRTPGYSLAGPQLRVELIVPFSDTVRLRIGPELLWAVALDQTLQDQGVESQAIALGGEVALSLRLGAVIGFELCYRESHGFASTTRTSAAFEDVERFATLRLLGSL